MTQRERLTEAKAKLKAIEAMIPELERNRGTVAIAKRIRAIMDIPEQKDLFCPTK